MKEEPFILKEEEKRGVIRARQFIEDEKIRTADVKAKMERAKNFEDDILRLMDLDKSKLSPSPYGNNVCFTGAWAWFDGRYDGTCKVYLQIERENQKTMYIELPFRIRMELLHNYYECVKDLANTIEKFVNSLPPADWTIGADVDN